MSSSYEDKSPSYKGKSLPYESMSLSDQSLPYEDLSKQSLPEQSLLYSSSVEYVSFPVDSAKEIFCSVASSCASLSGVVEGSSFLLWTTNESRCLLLKLSVEGNVLFYLVDGKRVCFETECCVGMAGRTAGFYIAEYTFLD
jgi:hypothetical protein